MTASGIAVAEFGVADPADAWAAAGFTVGPDDVCRVGGVGIRLVGRDRGLGIVGWALRGLPDGWGDDLDGIPTATTDAVVGAPGPAHANGVLAIDHVVLLTPDLGRTVAALAGAGAAPRRERDGRLGGRPMRQVFFRFGEVIVEVVGSPEESNPGPATLWGLTYVVDDVDASAALFGDRASPVKDAVQPGRRITTLRHRDLGLSVRTALISPHPRSSTAPASR